MNLPKCSPHRFCTDDTSGAGDKCLFKLLSHLPSPRPTPSLCYRLHLAVSLSNRS